jgi:ABC-type glycerol-3-phosphate transport system substrate-binding protein
MKIIGRKLISILLIGLFCFTVLSGCRSSAGVDGDKTKETGKPEETAEDQTEEEIDLNGEVFTFRAYDYLLLMKFAQKPDTETAITFIDDAKLKKIAETEEKLNCKIEWNYDTAEFAKALTADFATGMSDNTDIIYDYSKTLLGLYKSGIIVNLQDIEAINLQDYEKWGTETMQKMCTYKDEVFAIPQTGSLYWPECTKFEGCLLSNNELIKKFNVAAPSELIEQGK